MQNTDKNGNQIQLFVGFNVGNEMIKALDVKNVNLPKTAVKYPEGHKLAGQQRKNKKGKLMFRAAQNYTAVSFLPTVARDGKPSIATQTKLAGQDLFTFEKDAQRAVDLGFLAAVTEMLSTGKYNLSRARLNNKSGALSSTLKPKKEHLVPVITEQEAMKFVADQFGISVEKLASMKPATMTPKS
jgi:hypothetical protein